MSSHSANADRHGAGATLSSKVFAWRRGLLCAFSILLGFLFGGPLFGERKLFLELLSSMPVSISHSPDFLNKSEVVEAKRKARKSWLYSSVNVKALN